MGEDIGGGTAGEYNVDGIVDEDNVGGNVGEDDGGGTVGGTVGEDDGGGTAGEDDMDGGLEEEHCDDFEAGFGIGAREYGDARDTDVDSGEEIWDDERIPEPLADSDDELGPEEEGVAAPEAEDLEVLLRLGKTFNGPEEFKIAVLRYSLKTRYDIKLYKSQSLRIGAKRSSTDVKCPWRCYSMYDKKTHKMQLMIYDDKHVCVRSGYSKMVK